ncbi:MULTISPECIES: hypothetical protein [unclassified Limnohabitans]|jgi:hypothetical protein|uniref:hypothetical protein n=1 Tax=unclassified Limnohabitans TaxID=2626134 RepID=UPI000B2657CB|nr:MULTISPECIES: hypothetical protein [unclassified Limnohabitans]PUE21172.1 hypothetical protein B9Z48_01720 [Limnohabitans sp. WS1]
MIILADNDIVHKLACCDLLNSFLEWIGSPPAEVWVIPSIPFVLRKKLKNNPAALDCLEAFLLKTQPIPKASIELLERYEQLDEGERQMLAVLVEDHRITRLVTGDKRALRQIARMVSGDLNLSLRLNQTRTDCLESVMLGLMDHFGYLVINDKASLGVDSDKVLKMTFGPARSEAHAREVLSVYLEELKNQASFIHA